jgi:hypothetical protein
MKKLIAILAILMLVPFTAFGLEALSEDVLDDVTGQAGVSIATDININMTMDTLAWGDKDGLGAGSTATQEGWIGLSDFNMTNLRVRLDSDQFGDLALMQIDVATSDAAGFGVVYDRVSGTFVAGDATNSMERAADTTFVRIGLGSTLITMDEMKADVVLASSAAAVHGSTSKLGNFVMTNMAMRIDAASYVDISSHSGSGVTIDLAVKINSITMAGCAWGDSDGLGDDVIVFNDAIGDSYALTHTASTLNAPGCTSGGYVGLKDMTITNLVITGQVLIDVATIEAGATAGTIPWVYAQIQAQPGNENMGDTAVIIQLNKLAIGMDKFEADVALSNVGALTTGAGTSTMGSIYISNMDVTVDGWVCIGAH